MGRLTFMNRKGDTGEQWSVDDAGSVTRVRETFDLAIRKGAFAVEVLPNGQHEQVTSFKPEAEEILVIPQIRGGAYARVVA